MVSRIYSFTFPLIICLILLIQPNISFAQPGSGTFYLNVFSSDGKQIFIDSSQKSTPAGYSISRKIGEYSKKDTSKGQIYFMDKSRIGDTLEFISCTAAFQVHESNNTLLIVKNNCDTMRITFRNIPKEVINDGIGLFVDSIYFNKGAFVCDLSTSKFQFINRKENERNIKRICNACYYVVFKQEE